MKKQIDLNIWVTQQAFADIMSAKLGKDITIQRVNNWVKRGKIDKTTLPGSSIILVNKDSLTIDFKHHKCQ